MMASTFFTISEGERRLVANYYQSGSDLPKSHAENSSATLPKLPQASSTPQNLQTQPPNLARIAKPTPLRPRSVKVPGELASIINAVPEERILAVDLNGDGSPEYLAEVDRCGSGGCTPGVFEHASKGFVNLMGPDADELLLPSTYTTTRFKPPYQAGPQYTNGYLDIFVYPGKRPMRFEFDGRKYRLAK